MNNRDYKILRAGCIYHIYNRGNDKKLTFLDSSDYQAFLLRLKLLQAKPVSKIIFATRKNRVRITPFKPDDFTILAYCLMPNHFHLLIKQNSDVSVGVFMKRLLTSYSKYFNVKHEQVGNLFQDVFKAKLVETDEYATYVSAYIHNNPEDLLTWQYSSFPDYCLGRPGIICDKSFILSYFKDDSEMYKSFVLGLQKVNPMAHAYNFDEK